jgi:hypothetical protein
VNESPGRPQTEVKDPTLSESPAMAPELLNSTENMSHQARSRKESWFKPSFEDGAQEK